jgi:hypothetical protein
MRRCARDLRRTARSRAATVAEPWPPAAVESVLALAAVNAGRCRLVVTEQDYSGNVRAKPCALPHGATSNWASKPAGNREGIAIMIYKTERAPEF